MKPVELTEEQSADLETFVRSLEAQDEAAMQEIQKPRQAPRITLHEFLKALANYLRTEEAKALFKGETVVQINGPHVEVIFPPRVTMGPDGVFRKTERQVTVPVTIFQRDVVHDDCDYADLAKAMFEHVVEEESS